MKAPLPLSLTIIGLALLTSSLAIFAQPLAQTADDTAADSFYIRGKKALGARDGQTASIEFSQCIIEQPKNVECHWELGWSFFLMHDYEKTQSAWYTVKRMAPKKPGLTKALKTIHEHVTLAAQAHALRAASPTSVAADDVPARTLIKIRAVGDTMLGTNFPRNMLPPDNTSPLQQITPLLQGADITFANYEGTLCDGGQSQKCAAHGSASAARGRIPEVAAAHGSGGSRASMRPPHLGILPGASAARGRMPEVAAAHGSGGTPASLHVVRGTKQGVAQANCFAFRSPRKFAEFVKEAGFDVVSLANNHILDFGEDCRDQTEKTLDALGIAWSGRQGTVARFERNAIPFSFIAFHSARHTNTTLDIEAAQQMIAAEKALGNLVMVSFHGGAEGLLALHVPHKAELFMSEDRGHVRRFAHAVVDAGADIVLGSGPHVVRGMEVYKDRLIAYSLGNFATYRAFNIWGLNGIGLILEADIDDAGRFVSGKIIPTRQTGFGVPVLDEKMIATDVIRVLSKQDFPNTGVIIAQDGTLQKKSTMPHD